MCKNWAIVEILCVIFLILCLKKYEWSEIQDTIKNTFLKSAVEVYDTSKLIYYRVAVITRPTKKSPILCGGSLISKNYVLTAAHCLQGVNHAKIILSPGNFDYVEKEECTLESSRFKIHPKWQPNILVNDIALIEVQTKKYSDIFPIPLLSNGDIKNKEGTIEGWEENYNKNKKKSLNLRIYNVTIIKNEECKKHFGRLLQQTNLCTQSSILNGCHGFSGSPLIVEGIQVALVSFGTDECNIGYPTVYTRVSEYTKWIEENSDVTIS